MYINISDELALSWARHKCMDEFIDVMNNSKSDKGKCTECDSYEQLYEVASKCFLPHCEDCYLKFSLPQE